MFSELFLPEILNGKRVLRRTILSVLFDKNKVFAALVDSSAQRNKILELQFSQIEQNNQIPENERIIEAIKSATAGMQNKFDFVLCVLPSSLAIFKELTLPFTSRSKIEMVLGYEIESKLPFSLESSVYDFVITRRQKKGKRKESDIVAVVTRKEFILNYLSLMEAAGIKPDMATVDTFALYSIFRRSKTATMSKNAAIVELGTDSTQIIVMNDGILRFSRDIPGGYETVVQKIAASRNKKEAEVIKMLTERNYFELETDFSKALKDAIFPILHDIQFTLNSLSSKELSISPVNRLFLSGESKKLLGLEKYCHELLQIRTESLNSEEIIRSCGDKIVAPVPHGAKHLAGN